MMTPEQIERLYDKMVDYWGGSVPNPEHHPKQFLYCINLFKYFCPTDWEAAVKGTQDAEPGQPVKEDVIPETSTTPDLDVDINTQQPHN